jgi:hypothetical protein
MIRRPRQENLISFRVQLPQGRAKHPPVKVRALVAIAVDGGQPELIPGLKSTSGRSSHKDGGGLTDSQS